MAKLKNTRLADPLLTNKSPHNMQGWNTFYVKKSGFLFTQFIFEAKGWANIWFVSIVSDSSSIENGSYLCMALLLRMLNPEFHWLWQITTTLR